MIRITNNIEEANAITHGGTFHGDDIMATVILKKVFKDLIVCRVNEIPNNVPTKAVMYDIGGGKFDHHQKNGNGRRYNGVPYSSCGLIWKTFGSKVIKNVTSLNTSYIWNAVDKEIISGIDAVDNADLPKIDYPARIFNISAAISSFNPTWDSSESVDDAFLRAVEMAETIFDNVFKNALSKSRAKPILDELIDECDGEVLILNNFLPWQDYIYFSEKYKASTIKFVIFPSNRGKGYNWQCVKNYSNMPRKAPPKEWWGASASELKSITGIETARFCHTNNGFIGGCDTLKDAIKMAKLAIKS